MRSHFGGSSKDYFEGLPIPGAAGWLVSFVLAYSMLEGEGGMRNIPIIMNQMPFAYAALPFVMVILALLMVSAAPYAAFKGDMIKANSMKGILLITAVLSMIVAYPQDVLFLLFTVYAASGIVAGIYMAAKGVFGSKKA